MGDIADMILDGTLCQGCGEFIGEDFPSYCGACVKFNKADEHKKLANQQQIKKIKCKVCQRTVKPVGMKDHLRDAHGIIGNGATNK